jgi:hypothetical protein
VQCYYKSIKGTFAIHRIIWVMFHGEISENYDIDHIDQNGLNNKISNLRIVPRNINSRNSKLRKDNSSGYIGICRESRRDYSTYRCYYRLMNGKTKYKYFSIDKYGETKAKEMTIEWQKNQIEQRKKEGYTENHGRNIKICEINE